MFRKTLARFRFWMNVSGFCIDPLCYRGPGIQKFKININQVKIFSLDLGFMGFRQFMFSICWNSCRCHTLETEECDIGIIDGNAGCLAGIWEIWLYSVVTRLKCFSASHRHSLSLGQSRSDSQQVLEKNLGFQNYSIDLMCLNFNSEAFTIKHLKRSI